jgi:hypothetical protein
MNPTSLLAGLAGGLAGLAGGQGQNNIEQEIASFLNALQNAANGGGDSSGSGNDTNQVPGINLSALLGGLNNISPEQQS